MSNRFQASSRLTEARGQDTVVGTAIAIGAGVGTTVGILVTGGAAIAIGAGIGAGIGLAIGAAWDALHKAD